MVSRRRRADASGLKGRRRRRGSREGAAIPAISERGWVHPLSFYFPNDKGVLQGGL
jgi:hypothetical protein